MLLSIQTIPLCLSWLSHVTDKWFNSKRLNFNHYWSIYSKNLFLIRIDFPPLPKMIKKCRNESFLFLPTQFAIRFAAFVQSTSINTSTFHFTERSKMKNKSNNYDFLMWSKFGTGSSKLKLSALLLGQTKAGKSAFLNDGRSITNLVLFVSIMKFSECARSRISQLSTSLFNPAPAYRSV